MAPPIIIEIAEKETLRVARSGDTLSITHNEVTHTIQSKFIMIEDLDGFVIGLINDGVIACPGIMVVLPDIQQDRIRFTCYCRFSK